MEILTIIVLICVAIMFYVLIRIMRGMERLKRQNDIIYQVELRKSKDLITEDIPYDFEFESDHIKEIPMSTRLFCCLNAMEIEYLSQITQYTRKEILEFRNFEKKFMFELEELMDKYNLKFK